jgi:hypothetical protein
VPRFFGRIKGSEVLADDLLGGEALDALRAGVPACDAARRVEQENGVILRALHEQTEQILTLGPLLWRCGHRAVGVPAVCRGS